MGKWKQNINRVREDNEEDEEDSPEVLVCPHCGRELQYILEDASASEVVYYQGYRTYNWEEGYFEYYDSGDWEETDRTDWEEEGSGLYRCPYCLNDITSYVEDYVRD